MTSIGEALRSERMRRNLELEQISHELKIPQRLLAAIENDKFDQLRGAVFAKSFVRQYAALLGLDAEEMAAQVGQVFTTEPAESDRWNEASSPVAEMDLPRLEAWGTIGGGRRFSRSSSLPALALVVLVMLVCSGVYTFWQRSRRIAAAREAAVPVEQAARKAVPAPAPVPAAAAHAVPVAPLVTTPETAAVPPGGPPSPVAKTEEPSAKLPADCGEMAASPAPGEPKPAAREDRRGRSALDPNAPVRVELVALGAGVGARAIRRQVQVFRDAEAQREPGCKRQSEKWWCGWAMRA